MIEIAIATFSKPGNRVKEGDIVAVRPPSNGVGLKEMRDFIWLRVDGYDWHADSGWLMQPGGKKKRKKKRRYNIPFSVISAVSSSLGVTFDQAKARDPDIPYQPFLPVDAKGLFQTVVGVFPKLNLIFDKDEGRFI